MTRDTNDLEPISPAEAKEMYLNQRRSEVSDNTLQAHHYRLGHFVRWCDEQEIENLNELGGRDLHRYKLWRREDGDLNNVTMVTQLSTLRVFIRWCEQIDGVREGLHDKILLPTLGRTENQSDAILTAEEANRLIEYLRQFEFATRTHALVEVLWHTGMRIGTVHGLDVEDYDPESHSLKIKHRRETGTRLKNGEAGERYVALSPDVCDTLDAYIQFNRIKKTDKHGREPLFTSREGRPAKSTIRDSVYRITRPCIYTGDCPHGRIIEDCEAMDSDRASKCPSSVSPHAIRRGSITYHLSRDVPDKVVSDRMNVSLDVLEKHYDRRSERDKAEQRRDYLDDL